MGCTQSTSAASKGQDKGASIPTEGNGSNPSTGSLPVTQPAQGCSCGCPTTNPASGNLSEVGTFDIHEYPAATSKMMSETINIAVMFVNGVTTDGEILSVTSEQQDQVKAWWNYAASFYTSRNPNLRINFVFYTQEVTDIPPNPQNADNAEKFWRNPAVFDWLTARGLPTSNDTAPGLVNINTLVEYVRDNRGNEPTLTQASWAFVCFVTNLPHAAKQSPTYFGPNQRVVQYYNYQQSFNFGATKDQLVYTHEMGHVFGARDEYAMKTVPAGYDPCKGTNGVPNYNADACAYDPSLKTNCLMKEIGSPDGDKMCYYTRGQIGWPVFQPVQSLVTPEHYSARTYCSMSAVSYNNALWVFYAQSGSNYLSYNTTTDMLYWESGHISDYKVTQTEKSTAAVVYNGLLYVFYIPKDHQQFEYVFYDKNTSKWSGCMKLEAGMGGPVYSTFLSAAVLGTTLYLFFEPALGPTQNDNPKGSVQAYSVTPDGTKYGVVTIYNTLNTDYLFKPSDFGLGKNDIKTAAVTVMRQTKKNADGTSVTTQNMVLAYTQYTLNNDGSPKPVGVLSCVFPDGASSIVGATWICNPNGPQLQRSNAGESLAMLSICSSDNDFGTYYLAGVDNYSDTTGAVNRSSSTDLHYFAPVVSNDNYGFGGVATAVFNNRLVTFSAKPGEQNGWYVWQETGNGV